MKLRWLVACLAVGAAACGLDPDPPDAGGETDCTNGVDDDANGFADCADAACAEATNCLPPPDCTKQIDCFTGGQKYGDYTTTKPMPLCVNQKCVSPDRLVEIRMSLRTDSYAGLPCQMGAVNTRFVKKAAVDGSLVTCQRLATVASSKSAADSNAIERTNQFNLQAWEAIRLSPMRACGNTIDVPIIDVATGGDFLVWAEIWSDQINSDTKLPMGTRWGWACVENGIQVDPILATDNTLNRNVSITMPPPQGYPP